MSSRGAASDARLQRVSRGIGLALCVLGGLVLLGWLLGDARLKSVLPGLVSMKPNTAVGFEIIGLLVAFPGPRLGRRAQALASLLVLLGGATLIEYVSGWDLHVDQLLFRDDGHERFLGRMSFATAVDFGLVGFAVLGTDLRVGKSGKRPAEWALLGVGFSALIGLLGYLYGVMALYALGPYFSFALHTAVAFLLTAIALLLARPDDGLVKLFTSDGPGGVLARRLLPAVILGPPLIGWVRLWGQRAGYYQTEFGLALFATCNVVCFTGLVWWTAVALTRSDQALRESEARFRRLLESGIIGVVLADTSGGIHEANDAFLKIVGYSREDLEAGKLSSARLNPPELQAARATAQGQLEVQGVTLPWEKEFIRKDGSRVPVLIGVTMLEPPNCLNVVVDLTEQKRAEQAVRSLREERVADAKFRALLEAAPDAMVIADARGRIVLVNAETERLFGYAREEVLGHSLEDFIQRTPGSSSATEALGRRKDGSRFPVEMSQSPIETTEGLLTSSALRDITRRKEAELELVRAKEVAESASRELEAFSYSVAHDLRAPLRGIDGFSAALYEDYAEQLGGEAKDFLDRIRSSANQMALLIDALLQLARVNRASPSRAIVDLTKLGRAAVAQLQAGDPARSVEVSIAEGLQTWGDPPLLRALLDNLLGNAWKFTANRAYPQIELGATRDGERCVFFVRDNGAGFDPAYVHKLFSPFQRLHTASEFAGTGIGLATVQRIVQRHGGRIWAEGQVEKGATIRFTLAPEPVAET